MKIQHMLLCTFCFIIHFALNGMQHTEIGQELRPKDLNRMIKVSSKKRTKISFSACQKAALQFDYFIKKNDRFMVMFNDFLTLTKTQKPSGDELCTATNLLLEVINTQESLGLSLLKQYTEIPESHHAEIKRVLNMYEQDRVTLHTLLVGSLN